MLLTFVLQEILQSYMLFWCLDSYAALVSVHRLFCSVSRRMVPRYQPCVCVLVAFSVNYWQSTNSYEAVFSYACIFSSPLGLTVQPMGLLGKKRGSQEVPLAKRCFPGKLFPWVGSEQAALNRGCRRGSRVELDYSTGGRRFNLFPILLMTDFFLICWLFPASFFTSLKVPLSLCQGRGWSNNWSEEAVKW